MSGSKSLGSRSWSGVVALASLCGVLIPSRVSAGDDLAFSVTRPVANQLSRTGAVMVEFDLPSDADFESLSVTLDGVEIVGDLSRTGDAVSGSITVAAPGQHLLHASVDANREGQNISLEAQVAFETIDLPNPDECEVLNPVDCMLPYPSSRFLVPADTPTGYRLNFPPSGMPKQHDQPLSPEPYRVSDGFSPTVQILMHFPGGVDPELSGASRLLAETRTYDLTSVQPDSPTVLIDWDTGERILHFIEVDARAEDPARQVVFLRPGKSLLPGHHYIVAIRTLRHPDGEPVMAEAPFAALRDQRPTDIGAIESRRDTFADIFTHLEQAGVAREDLILAFDFVVASDENLTGAMLAMRDYSFDWIDGEIDAGAVTFTVDNVIENNCSAPNAFVWRQVEGTYEVPLFLTSDPVADIPTVGVLNVDDSGNPAANGFTNPDYTIIIPCAVLVAPTGDCDGNQKVSVDELVKGLAIALGSLPVAACESFDVNKDHTVMVDEVVRAVDASLNGVGAPLGAAVVGHGLFMTGREFVPLVAAGLGTLVQLVGQEPIELIGGGTDWRTFSTQDLPFISSVIGDLNKMAAIPDRLRQGQLNALVLGRMMKRGGFNRHPAFQTPSGKGVFAGPDGGLYYYGISLGGIMGLMHAALSPDARRLAIDEGSINFSLLLQRSTQAKIFEAAFVATGITDPLQTALLLSITHELWVRGESAGYATHITSNPLPGTPAKQILMTAAWLDPQVTNFGSEITVRTLDIPNLVPGSLVSQRPQIPDQSGPLPSAFIMYDAGSFTLSQPGPWIPPLANLISESNRCDPHGERRPTIPASLQQIATFFKPGGLVENFCHDACDAGDEYESPLGLFRRCDASQ